MNRILSLKQFSIKKMNEDFNDSEDDDDDDDVNVDMSNFNTDLLDELVELVGSEEAVEEAAAEAYEDLEEAFEKGEVEVSEEDIPENLAVASLILKLVEMGSLNPEDADGLIAKYVG